jgi:NB-ARC domain
MPEPMVTAIAGRLAGSLVGLAVPRLKDLVLGPEQQRALERAMRRAVATSLERVAPRGSRMQDSLGEAETLLDRLLSDQVVAAALLDDAFDRSTLDLGLLYPLIDERGIDIDTFPVDLDELLVSLADEIRYEVSKEARQPGSPLFNSLVIDQLDSLGRRLAQLGPGLEVGVRRGPPVPSLLIGRDRDLDRIKARLGVGSSAAEGSVQALTAVRGWPGVGKTTLAAALFHDDEVGRAFPDGLLWATATDRSRVRTELVGWSRVLIGSQPAPEETVADISARLAGVARERRMLLVIDDVWEPEHARPLLIGGRSSVTLVTTREPAVAGVLAPTAEDVYSLEVLGEDDSVELIARFAPTVVTQHPDAVRQLVVALEGLPLALSVAGRTLQAEAQLGWGVEELLGELRDGTRVLNAEAPADRADLESATIPTVAALLRQSTARLPDDLRSRFADLGAFEQRPASFNLAAMAAVWQVDDPRPTVRVLVQRGLLEPAPGGRFWMHALLAMHAQELLDEE